MMEVVILVNSWIIVVGEGGPSDAGARVDTGHMVPKRVWQVWLVVSGDIDIIQV
jgi:hypothetical protein